MKALAHTQVTALETFEHPRMSSAPTGPWDDPGYQAISEEDKEAFRETFYARESQRLYVCVGSDGSACLQRNPCCWSRYQKREGIWVVVRPKPRPLLPNLDHSTRKRQQDEGRRNAESIAQQLNF